MLLARAVQHAEYRRQPTTLVFRLFLAVLPCILRAPISFPPISLFGLLFWICLLAEGAWGVKEPFSYLMVDDCPTQLLRYASDRQNVSELAADARQDLPKRTKMILFVVPGPIGFYADFMKEIYAGNEENIEVWGVSHAGHVVLPKHMQKPYKSIKRWFSTEGEVEHKMRFLEKFIPKETPLVLIGHSIGSYMALQITDKLKDHNIVHTYLLFPAIERLARGINAPMLEALATYLRQPFMALVYSVHMVPAMLLKRVFQLAVRMHYGAGKETFVQNILSLTSPSVMRAIIDTTQDIFKKVRRRDDDAIARNLDKLTFYYGLNDHWAPREFPMQLRRMFPRSDVRFCLEGFRHAFVVDAGREMGHIVKGWMLKQNILPSKHGHLTAVSQLLREPSSSLPVTTTKTTYPMVQRSATTIDITGLSSSTLQPDSSSSSPVESLGYLENTNRTL
ncbi:lipid droplet-associated hydrolase-like isoform X2 [Varroa jacobsoni]|uniref:lipid droplet-associated hydrolase-like isoform X2 n=1 Tax=Varroa jacobsoni TaxID=62625 RepID=UPI000BF730AC|nr:lipid droplet-associated hydrolase-like isoform X2 [Varroa jacobsoni]